MTFGLKKILQDYILLMVLTGFIAFHTTLIVFHLTNKFNFYGVTNFYAFLTYAIFFELSLLGLYLFYVFSLQRFKEPLRIFKCSAEKLGIDLNASPSHIFGPQMVRDAADAINKLQLRIQDLIKTRTQLLAAISHDLRNPITRLKLRTQFIEDKTIAEKIQNDLTDMELMISGVLNFTREDSFKEQKIAFDIVSLVSAVCEDFMDIGNDVTLEKNQERKVYFGRRLAFKRTFTNLIQNAIKYGEKAHVILEVDASAISIIIEDNGPGIPEDEMTLVLKPFYRSEFSRESHSGFGLGLTISNEIIRAHEGTLTLENREKGGLRVKVRLPLGK
jgi:signal transduction histidine kinase